MEAKFGPLEKKDKKDLYYSILKFPEQSSTTFLNTKGIKKFWRNLKVEPVDDKPSRYKYSWPRCVTRMNSSRMAKIMLIYRPNGRRRLGRPMKRLLDVVETVLSGPNSCDGFMMMIKMKMTNLENFR